MTAPVGHPAAAPAPRPGPRATVTLAVFSLLPAVVVFACAGSVRWAAAWCYVGTLWIATVGTRLLILQRHGPALVAERAASIRRADVPPWDRVIVPLIAFVGPVASWVLAGLTFRYAWWASFPVGARIAAFALLVAGSGLVAWAMVSNPFFSAVARIQDDRAHAVVSAGPYRLVRHPGYLGMLVANLATPFVLDAPWTFLPIGIVAVLMVVRTALEDRMLRAGLPGYEAYARATPARLVPRVW